VIRTRAIALAFVLFFLGLALAVRVLSGQGVLDSSGALPQYSGTTLYAAMIYAGFYVLVPRASPFFAGGAALVFCWLIELFQLTGIPAGLSARSTFARLALGVTFDASDLFWYAVGVIPLVAIHTCVSRYAVPRPSRQTTS
jgi:hypothetical protein